VPDPNTPFSAVSDTRDAVDQVQYPRALLASRTGDCDDMSVLFCAVLENVGVPTAFLDGPGHILMMFDSGIHPRNALALSVPEELYAVRGERVWIPVETTMIGKSFLDAWTEGAGIYRRWESGNDFHVVPVEEARAEYVPSLPETEAPKVAPPAAELVDRRMSADLDSLKSWQTSFLRSRFLDPLEGQKSDADVGRENQLGLLYALEGRFDDARAQWGKRLAADPADADALNNLGNVHLLEGRADSALVLYDRALVLDRDPGTLLIPGLARWARGDEAGADESFIAALRKLPDPAEAERLLGLPAPAGGQGASPRRVTPEEIRQRLRQAASRVPRQGAAQASGTRAEGERPVKVVSKVSGARAGDLKNLARVVYWKGHERGKS
jgi:tetratricopeptide (TPR) repeat protein